jgi:hypothetical protein
MARTKAGRSKGRKRTRMDVDGIPSVNDSQPTASTIRTAARVLALLESGDRGEEFTVERIDGIMGDLWVAVEYRSPLAASLLKTRSTPGWRTRPIEAFATGVRAAIVMLEERMALGASPSGSSITGDLHPWRVICRVALLFERGSKLVLLDERVLNALARAMADFIKYEWFVDEDLPEAGSNLAVESAVRRAEQYVRTDIVPALVHRSEVVEAGVPPYPNVRETPGHEAITEAERTWWRAVATVYESGSSSTQAQVRQLPVNVSEDGDGSPLDSPPTDNTRPKRRRQSTGSVDARVATVLTLLDKRGGPLSERAKEVGINPAQVHRHRLYKAYRQAQGREPRRGHIDRLADGTTAVDGISTSAGGSH